MAASKISDKLDILEEALKQTEKEGTYVCVQDFQNALASIEVVLSKDTLRVCVSEFMDSSK